MRSYGNSNDIGDIAAGVLKRMSGDEIRALGADAKFGLTPEQKTLAAELARLTDLPSKRQAAAMKKLRAIGNPNEAVAVVVVANELHRRSHSMRSGVTVQLVENPGTGERWRVEMTPLPKAKPTMRQRAHTRAKPPLGKS